MESCNFMRIMETAILDYNCLARTYEVKPLRRVKTILPNTKETNRKKKKIPKPKYQIRLS